MAAHSFAGPGPSPRRLGHAFGGEGSALGLGALALCRVVASFAFSPCRSNAAALSRVASSAASASRASSSMAVDKVVSLSRRTGLRLRPRAAIGLDLSARFAPIRIAVAGSRRPAGRPSRGRPARWRAAAQPAACSRGIVRPGRLRRLRRPRPRLPDARRRQVAGRSQQRPAAVRSTALPPSGAGVASWSRLPQTVEQKSRTDGDAGAEQDGEAVDPFRWIDEGILAAKQRDDAEARQCPEAKQRKLRAFIMLLART